MISNKEFDDGGNFGRIKREVALKYMSQKTHKGDGKEYQITAHKYFVHTHNMEAVSMSKFPEIPGSSISYNLGLSDNDKAFARELIPRGITVIALVSNKTGYSYDGQSPPKEWPLQAD